MFLHPQVLFQVLIQSLSFSAPHTFWERVPSPLAPSLARCGLMVTHIHLLKLLYLGEQFPPEGQV